MQAGSHACTTNARGAMVQVAMPWVSVLTEFLALALSARQDNPIS